jgi:hypothetical protein
MADQQLNIKQISVTAGPYENKNINYIHNLKWGSSSVFNFEELIFLNPPNSSVKIVSESIFLASQFALAKDMINTAIVAVTTPNITSQPIEEWVGGQWAFTNGRQELRQLEITFRDTADALLWKNFVYIYDECKNGYPDDIKWNINLQVMSLESVVRDDNEGHTKATIIATTEAILTQVSSISYSKESADMFTTFTVTFKYYNYKRTSEASTVTSIGKSYGKFGSGG